MNCCTAHLVSAVDEQQKRSGGKAVKVFKTVFADVQTCYYCLGRASYTVECQ